MQKNCQFWIFFEACRHTVLPDRSILIGHNVVKNAKIESDTFWLIFRHGMDGFTTLY